MAFKDHKKGITRAFIMMLALFTLCFLLFSCTSYMTTKYSTYIDENDMDLIQLEEPEDSDMAMCMHTTAGDIVAVLYPEEAPLYVEQFTTLAEEGYYDNTYVYQVEQGVYFEAGSPNADGTLTAGTDATYESVEREVSSNLWPFRGAFCVPTVSTEGGVWDRITGKTKTYCGTRFAVCNSIEFDDETIEELESLDDTASELNEAFIENGGIPNYSQQMTIFAQAYGDESFATIDKIVSAEVVSAEDEDDDTPPVEDILITGIEIGVYGDFQ